MKKSPKLPARPDLTGPITLSNEPQVIEALHDSILKLWEAVNTLTRVRPTRRSRYRATIFGSARVPKNHWVYKAVRDLSAELTRLDCDIISGGGPGLMQAANEGVHKARPNAPAGSVGIRVDLPFEQEVNSFVNQAFEHGTFFTRLHHFVLLSDAFIVVPGGIGTVLETMMIWQLLQVQKMHNVPLILVGDMYKGLVDWCKSSMLRADCPLASAKDMEIPVCVDDGDAVVKMIRQHHAAWRKMHGKARR